MFLIVGALYSLSEAVVSRLDVVWFTMLLAMVVYEPYRRHAVARPLVSPPPRSRINTPTARAGTRDLHSH